MAQLVKLIVLGQNVTDSHPTEALQLPLSADFAALLSPGVVEELPFDLIPLSERLSENSPVWKAFRIAEERMEKS